MGFDTRQAADNLWNKTGIRIHRLLDLNDYTSDNILLGFRECLSFRGIKTAVLNVKLSSEAIKNGKLVMKECAHIEWIKFSRSRYMKMFGKVVIEYVDLRQFKIVRRLWDYFTSKLNQNNAGIAMHDSENAIASCILNLFKISIKIRIPLEDRDNNRVVGRVTSYLDRLQRSNINNAPENQSTTNRETDDQHSNTFTRIFTKIFTWFKEMLTNGIIRICTTLVVGVISAYICTKIAVDDYPFLGSMCCLAL